MMEVECSGQHRSLGVHISFVRSVTMDSWREDQAKRMQLGGNDKALRFFQQYEISHLPIKQKYQTKAAAVYKDKLAAECEGRPFQVPPPSPELAQPPLEQQSSSLSSSPRAAPLTDKSRNEVYFAQRGMENASRPDNLPPSQGGKYTGFGSSYEPPARDPDPISDTFSALSKGFSMFSSKAIEVAKMAATQAETLSKDLNDNYIKPTTQRIQDPNFRQNITTSIQSLGKSVVETSDRSITYLTSAIAGDLSPRDAPVSPAVNEQSESEPFHLSEPPTVSSPPTSNTMPLPENPAQKAQNDQKNGSATDWDVKDDDWEAF
jgi:ADP-ribosylation factor GTPase-activating protein 1